MESEILNIFIIVKDVEKGEWGWKKIFVGYFVCFMYMRFDYLFFKFIIIRVDEEIKDLKKIRRKKNIVLKFLIWVKRIIIDLSRYGVIYLLKMMLEDLIIVEVLG